jgi:hypothetical protein
MLLGQAFFIILAYSSIVAIAVWPGLANWLILMSLKKFLIFSCDWFVNKTPSWPLMKFPIKWLFVYGSLSSELPKASL